MMALDGILDQRGFADAPTAGHLGEIPSVPADDLGKRAKLIRPTIKAPIHDAPKLR
jgi:hypothetical protein